MNESPRSPLEVGAPIPGLTLLDHGDQPVQVPTGRLLLRQVENSKARAG